MRRFKNFIFLVFDFLIFKLRIERKLNLNKKTLCFQVATEHHFEIIKNLFTNFKKKNFTLIIAVDELNESSINYLKKFCPNLIETKYLRFFNKLNILIKTSYEAIGSSKTKKILIFHGFPVKNTKLPIDYIKNIDHYFFGSKLEMKTFKFISRNFPKEYKRIKKYEIGYTKLDPLFRPNFKFKIKFKKRKKNIVYAPSWDFGTSLRKYGIKLINDLSESFPNYNFFIKPHPVLLLNEENSNFKFYTGSINWLKELKKIKKKNIFIVKDNIIELIKISDILITDISGVALEFLYFNKKVFFLKSENFYKITQKKRGFNSHLSKNDLRFNSGINYGIIANDPADLIQKLNKIKKNKHKNKNFRDKLNYFNKGSAILKASEQINKILLSD